MALNPITLEMLEMLPIWMKMRNDPENSEGAKFLDAPGKQVADIEALIENALTLHFPQLDTINIGGIDIGSVDILYKVHLQGDVVDADMLVEGEINGTNETLTAAVSVYDFYRADGIKKYFFDTDTETLYFKTKYSALHVNGALLTEVLEHEVWTPYDEIGLLLGCPRMRGEKNGSYKLRLMDAFQRPGNSTRQGLVNFISRSLGIPAEEVKVQELTDDYVKSLINADGTLKSELKEYIKISNKVNLSTSNTYWDVLEENKVGLSYLPMVWDTSLGKWNDGDIQSGIGDTGDLEIVGPEQANAVQDFTYDVGVEGLKISKRDVYPEHQFQYKLVAKGQKYDEGYKPEEYRYSVVASDLIPLEFKVKAHKNYQHNVRYDFIGQSIDYASSTMADTSRYITKNIVIQSGNVVMNPNNRYIEVSANLYTSDKAQSPVVNSITIGYKTVGDSTQKEVVITNQSGMTQSGATITTGFTTNTWNDASPILKIKNDTNDTYGVLTPANGTLTLSHGEYEKIYSSEGDWDDNKESETINVSTSTRGTLKLSI